MAERPSGPRKIVVGLLIFLIVAGGFYWVIEKDWRQAEVTTDAMNRDTISPELEEGVEISQRFTAETDQLSAIIIQANLLTSAREGQFFFCRLREGERLLLEKRFPVQEIPVGGMIEIRTEEISQALRGKQLTLELTGNGGVAFWMGSTRSAGKFSVEAEDLNPMLINGEMTSGELVLQQKGIRNLPYTRYYWPVVLCAGAVLLILKLYALHRRKIGKALAVSKGMDLFRQYYYLLKTLVLRDFKVRYKASVLGVVWSFLNPLLMTMVYYFVFSTIFRSSIPYFPAYLMGGIVIFNYFSEATNMGMQSIVGNAGLITKVYIPKYIFPISKALSSGINLVISLIPLFLMMAFTGVAFHKSLFLLPVVVFFLIMFCIGVSLILSACMVYFRDVQFLWGIMLTVLNFFSPIFYPESIIPSRFLSIYHINPLYQFLFFMRTITIGGISPTPVTYLYCAVASLGTLLIGLVIFRKAQSKFVLHL